MSRIQDIATAPSSLGYKCSNIGPPKSRALPLVGTIPYLFLEGEGDWVREMDDIDITRVRPRELNIIEMHVDREVVCSECMRTPVNLYPSVVDPERNPISTG